jgi:hypothetical protein
MDESFDYAREFQSLDLDAVTKDLHRGFNWAAMRALLERHRFERDIQCSTLLHARDDGGRWALHRPTPRGPLRGGRLPK